MGKQAEDILDIDLNNLEVELERIPKELRRYTKKLADVQEELQIAEDNLKLIKANLFLDIKENYQDYGFSKSPAEKTVEYTVLTQKKYRDKQREVAEIQRDVHILAGVVKSLEGANNNLRKSCDLFAVGYWAPKLSSKGRQASEQWGRAIYKEISERTRLKRGEE